MILVRVKVHCVYTTRVFLKIVQDVVTSTSDCQDHIVLTDVKKSVIYTRVFPGECVDVLILKLGVLGEHVIVVDPVVVILIESAWKRQVSAEVNHSRLVSLGSNLSCALLDGSVNFILVASRAEVRRFGERCIQLLDSSLAGPG